MAQPVGLIKQDTLIWVPSEKDSTSIYTLAKVVQVDEFTLTAKTEDGKKRTVNLDLSKEVPQIFNKKVEPDMTSLMYIHDAGILYNLEQRSFKSEPYTMIGSVLVSTNPLRPIPNPSTIGTKQVLTGPPHPYCIAENSFQQMMFQANREILAAGLGQPSNISKANQSIVIGGESGAGKTENAKMVLSHLVRRCNTDKASGDQLALRLLGTNPILEAFGNATTTRNPNSSRFGKLLKLNYQIPSLAEVKLGGEPPWRLKGASVKSYLLERSRVVVHEQGERAYHINHILVAAAVLKKSDEVAGLSLEGGEAKFRYMTPAHPKAVENLPRDAEMAKELIDAMIAVEMSKEDRRFVFEVVAAVLHMGNIEFADKDTNDGPTATVSNVDVLSTTAKLLGIGEDGITKMFTQRQIEVKGKVITTIRNARGAAYARDAVAKSIYSNLFDFLIHKINICLMKETIEEGKSTGLGVLDIFGFEFFTLNGFEQLLINYTNEALQGTFNNQIFVAEAELYKREGLFGSDEYIGQPADNGICIELLQGEKGLMMTIDSECRVPDPSDAKMNQRLHANFEKHPCMMKVHPKDKAVQFIIKHYAATVTYTVGTFIEKNNDKLPDDVDSVLRSTNKTALMEMLNISNGPVVTDKNARKAPAKSIIHKFIGQIKMLITDLESTKCSFIRCVKPNPKMFRDDADPSWFDRMYVTKQLNALNVPQTAEVLRNGFPTRIEYASLVDSYGKMMPAQALKFWKACGSDPKGFVRALFWAFEIDSSIYKLGMTRVFFKGGQLSVLDAILGSSTADEKIVKRFKFYYVRIKWRRAAVIARCQARLLQAYERAKIRQKSAVKLQKVARKFVARSKFKRLKRGALMVQKVQRGRIARKRLAKERAEMMERLKIKMEELKAKKTKEAAEELKRMEAEKAKMEKERKEREERAARGEAELEDKIMDLEDRMEEKKDKGRKTVAMTRRMTTVVKGQKGAIMLRLGAKLKSKPITQKVKKTKIVTKKRKKKTTVTKKAQARKIDLNALAGVSDAIVSGPCRIRMAKRSSVTLIASKLTGGGSKFKYSDAYYELDKGLKKFSVFTDKSMQKATHEMVVMSTCKWARNADDAKSNPNSVGVLKSNGEVYCVLVFDAPAQLVKFGNDFDEAKNVEMELVKKLPKPDPNFKSPDMDKVSYFLLQVSRGKLSEKEMAALVKEEFTKAKDVEEETEEWEEYQVEVTDDDDEDDKPPSDDEDDGETLPPLAKPFVKDSLYHDGKISMQMAGVHRVMDSNTFQDVALLSVTLQYRSKIGAVEWTVSHSFGKFRDLYDLLSGGGVLQKQNEIPPFPALWLDDNGGKQASDAQLADEAMAIERWFINVFKMVGDGDKTYIDELLPPPPPFQDPDTEDPDNWKAMKNQDTGDWMYHNHVTGETRNKDPFNGLLLKRLLRENQKNTPDQLKALPKGWEFCQDAFGDVYYQNTVTGQTSWERPKEVENKPKPKPVESKKLLRIPEVNEFFDIFPNVQRCV